MARVSRATSAHLRRSDPARAAAAPAIPRCTRSSAHAARSAWARRSASRGSTSRPAGPTTSGSAPTALATTGRAGGQCVEDRQGGRLAHDRVDDGAGAGDEAGHAAPREAPARSGGARRRRCAAAAWADGGAIVGSRVDQQDPRRPGHRLREAGRSPGRGEARQRVEERPEVVAGVVPAGVDEVPCGHAVPLALRVERRPLGVADLGAGHGERGEGVASGQGDDVETPGADPQEPRGGPGDGGAPHDDGIGLAQQLGPETLPESRRGRALVLLRKLPRGEVQERRDDREAGPDRQGAGHGVGHRAGAAGPRGRARVRCTERRAPDEERIERQRARTEDPRDGQPRLPMMGRPGKRMRGIVRSEVEEEDE